jgi:hypothetical protein
VLVSTRFQVLFHSPPGVLFTVPSQYYSLSVTREYLGLESGLPIFPPDSSCPAVLWIQPLVFRLRLRGFHAVSQAFPGLSADFTHFLAVRNPENIAALGLAFSAFARHY